jgi:hypothetical protein
MVTLARTSAKRILGMAADLGIGHAGVNGCGRYSDTSISFPRPRQCSTRFSPPERVLRFAISFAHIQLIDRHLEIIRERAEQVALLGLRVTM